MATAYKLTAALAIVAVVAGWMYMRENPPRALVKAGVVELKGYENGPGADPKPGVFDAVGVYTSSEGYARGYPGERIDRQWWIERRCEDGGCAYVLTREMRDLPPQIATLRRERDGWHAAFPPLKLQCGVNSAGEPVTWEQEDRLILRFEKGGRIAQGRATKFSYHPDCGYGAAMADWHVTRRAG